MAFNFQVLFAKVSDVAQMMNKSSAAQITQTHASQQEQIKEYNDKMTRVPQTDEYDASHNAIKNDGKKRNNSFLNDTNSQDQKKDQKSKDKASGYMSSLKERGTGSKVDITD